MTQMKELEDSARQGGLYPLRDSQKRALEGWIQGRDLLIIWPTGSGKSLCYQLPALIGGDLTIVVSPLIALMEDQVRKGRALGWPVSCVHSGVARQERESRLKAVKEGSIRLLYVTPERFRQDAFWEALSGRKVKLLAIDEAHCISQWGHDFRPDYSRLGEIRERMGRPQVMALTATATRAVQEDILRQLRVETKDALTLWEGVERPNLHLSVEETENEEDKNGAVLHWLKATAGPKLVYFTLIGTLEKTAAFLRGRGITPSIYHGELPDSERRRSHESFFSGKTDLMLATPAFGLGVDKADVRGILHYEVPGSLESYFQEVGRAGRDGIRSDCLLLYRQQDLETQMRFIQTLTPEPSFVQAVYNLLVSWQDRLPGLELDDLREQLSFKNKKDFRLETAMGLLERLDVIRWPHRRLKNLEILRPLEGGDLDAGLWRERQKHMHEKLLSLVQWVRSPECRKTGIYEYFGWEDSKPCGLCDNCERAQA